VPVRCENSIVTWRTRRSGISIQATVTRGALAARADIRRHRLADGMAPTSGPHKERRMLERRRSTRRLDVSRFHRDGPRAVAFVRDSGIQAGVESGARKRRTSESRRNYRKRFTLALPGDAARPRDAARQCRRAIKCFSLRSRQVRRTSAANQPTMARKFEPIRRVAET
jgi:hypothetical protein